MNYNSKQYRPRRQDGQPRKRSRDIFLEPNNIMEAKTRISEIIQATQEMESQLSQPNRYNPITRQRMTPREYQEWKAKVISAMGHMNHEKRMLRAWLDQRRAPIVEKDHYAKMLELGFDTLDPDQLLAFLMNYVDSHLDSDIEWNVQFVLEATRAYLDTL